MPQKAFEGVFFPKCPEIEEFYFRFFFCFKLITCFLFEIPHFLMFEIFEMPHFSHFQNQIGKIRNFKIFEHKKAGHFEILARDQFLN